MAKKEMHLIGNAHLDPVWLWRWQQGYAEVKATMISALERMEEFPDYKFTCAGVSYYEWIEEAAPEIFEKIQKYVKEGRWIITNGWKIQPDCNIPNGESFVRHGLYSQLYYLEKFGVISKTGYNVDSFGHNWQLPQILKKSGMDNYVFMRPGYTEKDIEQDVFIWESPDGSQVNTFRIPQTINGYGANTKVIEKNLEEIDKYTQELGLNLMYFYGVGNHGGGPTIKTLALIEDLREKYGKDRLLYSGPDQYFDSLSDEDKQKLPVLREDLQHHASGCYATTFEVKKANRRAELRLMQAERTDTLANILFDTKLRTESFKEAWDMVLFNQFHDIMGGCSIESAYDDALDSYGFSKHIAQKNLNRAEQIIALNIDTTAKGMTKPINDKELHGAIWDRDNTGAPLVVFNPLPIPVYAPVQAYAVLKSVTDAEGQSVPIQVVRAERTNNEDKYDTLFMAELPAMGYKVFRMYLEKEMEPANKPGELKVNDTSMENAYTLIEFDAKTGAVKSLIDKASGVNVLKGNGIVPKVIEDASNDTWSHAVWEFNDDIGEFGDAEITVLEKGPVRARIRVISKYNNSKLTQNYMMYADRKDVEVNVAIDWQEDLKILKLDCDVNVENPKATYEISYGTIEKSCNGEEEAGHRFMDVSGDLNGNTVGLSLINDSRYSYCAKDSHLRLNMVRSAIYADHFGGEYRDSECVYMDKGISNMKYMLVAHNGTWQEAKVPQKAEYLCAEFDRMPEPVHTGTLPTTYSPISIDNEQVILNILKGAEDGNGYVVRLNEIYNKACTATINLDMLGVSITADFKPHDIKSFRIYPDKTVKECNLLEQEL